MTAPHPTMHDVRRRHDDLIDRLHKEREVGGLSAIEIPAQLAGEIAEFTAELRALGAVLYNDTERSATLSLMSYWINALYRAEWYQGRDEEPPAPELADFSPDAQPPLREQDYPWAHSDGHEAPPEARALWARLTGQAVKVLESRRLIGITGAVGSGRSHLIEHNILPALREKKRGAGLREYIVNPGDAIVGPAASGASSDYDDRRFLTALLPIAKAAGSGQAVRLNEAALEKDPAALARMLDDSGERHLIVVQDLHQLFTLAGDPFNPEPTLQQRAFVSALCAIATSAGGHFVIVDVQTEILGRLRKFEDFRDLIDRPSEDNAQDGWLIVAFEGAELRGFITEPAARVGLHFEAGLVDRILLEHQSEPAALTLLLFTLRRLWRDMLLYHCNPGERRNMITWSNYQRVGSGRVVFEIAADEATKAVLDQEATEEDKKCALGAVGLVCLELVRILPGAAWWLDKVPRAKIKSDLGAVGHPPQRIERILSEFTEVGLFVQESSSGGGEMMVRIFHHAVVARWTRLVQWVEAKRAEMRTYWLFRADAGDWNRLREPSPSVRNAGLWVRVKDAFSRLNSRLSRLWSGSKLREARSLQNLNDLNPHERDFLRASWRMWRLKVAVLVVGIGSIPVALIAAFVLWEHQGRSLNTALLMDRGVNLVAEGDPGSASLWLVAVRWLDQHAPLKRLLNISSPAREATHKLSIGMAFRRLPALEGLMTVPDGLISTDISPTGRYALLGCRKQGDTHGCAILWTLDGAKEEKEDLLRDKEPEKGDFSIDRVAFARWAEDMTSRRKEDTLMAVGGSVGDGSKGVVFVWDLRDRRNRQRFDFGERVRDLAFFPGRKEEPWRLAVAFGDEERQPVRGGVEIIEMSASGNIPKRSKLPVDRLVTRVVLSENEQLAVAYSEPGRKAWRVEVFANEKENKNEWKGDAINRDLLQVTDLALSKDGRILAIATANAENSAGSTYLFTKETPDQPWEETTAEASLQIGSGVQRVEFSPDGDSLFGAASNGVIGIWSLDVSGKATLVHKLNEGGWTYSATWSPDGRWIATGNRDRYARLWDAASGQLVLPPLYHGGTVNNVHFTPNGLRLLTNTLDSARLWSTAPREDSLLPVQAVERRASHALLSEDGQRVAVVSMLAGQWRDAVPEAELALWQITPERSLVPESRLRRLPILDDIAMSADGRTIAALTVPQAPDKQTGKQKFRYLLVWNTTDRKLLETAVEPGADFLGFAPGSPQRLLVAGVLPAPERVQTDRKAKVGFIQLFDLSQPKLEARQVPLEFRVKACAATRDGTLLAVGGDGGGNPRGGFIGVLDVANAVRTADNPVRLGSAAVAPLSRHDEPITALAFSPDARWLLSGSIDDHVKLFAVDVTRRTPLSGSGDPPGLQWIDISPVGDAKLTKHTADVTSVGFSHNGRYAASTGRDSMAILWAVTNKGLEQRASLSHRGVVSRHAFSADDRRLATGGDDGARLWSLKTNDGFWETVMRTVSPFSFGLWSPKTDSQLRPTELVAALPHRFPVVGIAFRSSSDLAPGDLCTLAHERAAGDPQSSRAVEAHRWSLALNEGQPAESQKQAELLAGRMLDVDRLSVVGLGGDKLKNLWDVTKDKREPFRTDGQAHVSCAAAAAAAGDWKAAITHLRELPEVTSSGSAGVRQDVLRFAAEIFSTNRQLDDVFNTVEKLEPEKIEDEETRWDLMEKRGEACIQIARATTADAIQRWLDRAEKDFQTLARQQPREAAWRTRMAEISVLHGRLPEAINLLEESKRLASVPPIDGARRAVMVRLTTASQDQRIAAVRLLIAADAQREGDVAEASRQHQQWEELVRKTLDDHKTSEAFEKGRAAWPTVLGEPRDKQVIERALAFAGEGYRDRPDNNARESTYATALLRAGMFDQALLRLDDSILLYERTRDPLHRGKLRAGRPVDWVVRALILHGKSTQESDEMKREKLLAEARDSLEAAQQSLAKKEPQSHISWRATWNNVDLRVLVAEAERKLNRE